MGAGTYHYFSLTFPCLWLDFAMPHFSKNINFFSHCANFLSALCTGFKGSLLGAIIWILFLHTRSFIFLILTQSLYMSCKLFQNIILRVLSKCKFILLYAIRSLFFHLTSHQSLSGPFPMKIHLRRSHISIFSQLCKNPFLVSSFPIITHCGPKFENLCGCYHCK